VPSRERPCGLRAGLDYFDLYLLHWPVAGKRLDSWRALETLHADGRARAIGVSNFLLPHLRELLAHAKVAPMVNQLELTRTSSGARRSRTAAGTRLSSKPTVR
jgi:diketogulonate reductase-like aldo/keto reductase